MVGLVVLFIRLTIVCTVLTARLMYWMIKALIMLTAAIVTAISSASASRQRRPARR